MHKQLPCAIQIFLVLGGILVAASAPAPRQQVTGPAASVNPTQSGSANLPELRLGQPVERELKGGETHSYRVNLQAGQFMQVVVEQKGIDVVVALIGPDGKPIVEMDNPNGAWGPERVSLIAETSGNNRVDVRPNDKRAPPGGYEAKIAELRPATPQDRDRIAAERLFIEAVRLPVEGTKEARKWCSARASCFSFLRIGGLVIRTGSLGPEG